MNFHALPVTRRGWRRDTWPGIRGGLLDRVSFGHGTPRGLEWPRHGATPHVRTDDLARVQQDRGGPCVGPRCEWSAVGPALVEAVVLVEESPGERLGEFMAGSEDAPGVEVQHGEGRGGPMLVAEGRSHEGGG